MKKVKLLFTALLLLTLPGNVSARSAASGNHHAFLQACTAPGSISVSSISASGANITWTAAPGALFYQYKLTSSATPPVSGSNTSVSYYDAYGLSASTTYYFHVRSFCGSGYSAWSTLSFTTEDGATQGGNEFVVMTYNLLNYPGSNGSSREADYRTIVDSVQPDILVVQELSDPSGVTGFLDHVLNYGSSAYSAGTFVNGPDSDNGLFYKAALFEFISNTPVETDLRDINEFKLKHLASGDTLIVFSAHLKAGNSSSDAAQRAAEIDSLRKVTDHFHDGANFVVCGDFNFYGSAEPAYQGLIANGSNSNGKFNDVLSMSGTWNNSTYAFYHTQSPRTTSFGGGANGGLDDRFDLILFSDNIYQSGGFDIVSGSYKAYGNDGAHYNQALNTPPYTVYSPVTAAALHNASDHLPVIVTLRYEDSTTSRTSEVSQADVSSIQTIYPNPADDEVTVILRTTSDKTLFVRNAQGKVVLTRAIGKAATQLHISLSGLEPGIYYVHSETGDVFQLVIH